jgi:conjugal transfer pilus assembly protein TraW
MKKLIFLLLATLSVEAKHLGTFGHTFEIIEEDLLVVITKKLDALAADGTLTKHQLNVQAVMEAKIQRPTPAEGIIRTKKPRVFTYDPAIRIPSDLKDHKGNVFVKAGTIVNPLETHSLKQPLVFIDGDDETQVAWATQKSNDSKLILVNGPPFQLMNRYSRMFYFDQGGKLVKKFGIEQVPARVSQDARVLKVEELIIVDES